MNKQTVKKIIRTSLMAASLYPAIPIVQSIINQEMPEGEDFKMLYAFSAPLLGVTPMLTTYIIDKIYPPKAAKRREHEMKNVVRHGGNPKKDVFYHRIENFYSQQENVVFLNNLDVEFNIFMKLIGREEYTDTKSKGWIYHQTQKLSQTFKDIKMQLDNLHQLNLNIKFGIITISHRDASSGHEICLLYDFQTKTWEVFDSDKVKGNEIDKRICNIIQQVFGQNTCNIFTVPENVCHTIQRKYNSCTLWAYAWPYFRLKFIKTPPQKLYNYLLHMKIKDKHDLLFEFYKLINEERKFVISRHSKKLSSLPVRSHASSMDERISD